jgi:hypothetical protein
MSKVVYALFSTVVYRQKYGIRYAALSEPESFGKVCAGSSRTFQFSQYSGDSGQRRPWRRQAARARSVDAKI